MAIQEHPVPGSIVLCDFRSGFREPEMVKRRPVVVLSPKIGARPGLCTVVALSGTAPDPVMPYHCWLEVEPPLPNPWNGDNWVKGDMVNAVGFHRLDLIRFGKDSRGKRRYRYDTLTSEQMRQVRACVLKGLGLTTLTRYI